MTKTKVPGDRINLGTWPTPLEAVPRLSLQLGLDAGDLWVKRDDLTGLGAGGNKVRKLEFVCAAAIQNGADVLVTSGAAQSNHARLTAATGARLGLGVALVLAGDPTAQPTGNLVLDGLFGATVVWAGNVDDAGLDGTVQSVAAELRDQGSTPEVIPLGGSSPLGARGYYDCGTELMTQAPNLSTVVVAVGTGGSMAGLISALGVERILGVDTGAVSNPAERVCSLVEGLRDGGPSPTVGNAHASGAAVGDMPVPTFSGREIPGADVTAPRLRLSPSDLRLRNDQVGAGYSHLTDRVREALSIVARYSGIVLDPIYTGRAMAGLMAAIDDGSVRPGQRTVFLHTGGLPGLFGNPAAVKFGGDGLRVRSSG